VRLLIVTDAWRPQTNGVVTTLESVIERLRGAGHEVSVVEPGLFRRWPLPGYPEIRVAVNPWRVGRLIEAAAPDSIHVATEGPLGIAAWRWLRRRGVPFTTSLHTKFPEYLRARVGLPLSIGYAFLRAFHRDAWRTLVTTESHREELAARGFEHLEVWGRGVDTVRFRPLPRRPRHEPRLLYVGRVAVEKNLEAFLSLDVRGRKVIVGDGPARAALEARFPDAEWLGYRHGDALVEQYADADAFVFPSRTDTFGLVMLEANACGTPVAAYPVTGPVDVVVEGVNGALDADLAAAIERALAVDRAGCRTFAERHGWDAIADRLLNAQAPFVEGAHAAATP
jgi:glycosyltransferase involved in cell wall biosynthesis